MANNTKITALLAAVNTYIEDSTPTNADDYTKVLEKKQQCSENARQAYLRARDKREFRESIYKFLQTRDGRFHLICILACLIIIPCIIMPVLSIPAIIIGTKIGLLIGVIGLSEAAVLGINILLSLIPATFLAFLTTKFSKYLTNNSEHEMRLAQRAYLIEELNIMAVQYKLSLHQKEDNLLLVHRAYLNLLKALRDNLGDSYSADLHILKLNTKSTPAVTVFIKDPNKSWVETLDETLEQEISTTDPDTFYSPVFSSGVANTLLPDNKAFFHTRGSGILFITRNTDSLAIVIEEYTQEETFRYTEATCTPQKISQVNESTTRPERDFSCSQICRLPKADLRIIKSRLNNGETTVKDLVNLLELAKNQPQAIYSKNFRPGVLTRDFSQAQAEAPARIFAH